MNPALAAALAIGCLVAGVLLGRRARTRPALGDPAMRDLVAAQDTAGVAQLALPALADVLDRMPVSFTLHEHREDGDPVIFAGRRFEAMTGYRREEVLGRDLRFLQDEAREQPGRLELAEAIRTGRPATVRLENRHRDGHWYWALVAISPLKSADGRVTHFLGVQMDISATVSDEEQLRARQRQQYALAAVAQAAAESLTIADLADRVGTVLKSMLASGHVEILERSGDVLRSRMDTLGVPDAGLPIGPDSFAGYVVARQEAVLSADLEADARFDPGWLTGRGMRAAVGAPVLDEGRCWGFVGVFSEHPGTYRSGDADFVQAIGYLLGGAVTRLRQTDRMIENARFLDTVFEATEEAIVVLDENGRIERANEAFGELVEEPVPRFGGEPLAAILDASPEAVGGELVRRLASEPGRIAGRGGEVRLRSAEGTAIPVWISVESAQVDRRALLVVTLRDLRELRTMQLQLAQAQKMDALGQLTGGVAHDFNNLLTVIQGSAELALEPGDDEAERRELVESVLEASAKARELTGKLLAFARQQPLDPVRFSPQDLLGEQKAMLERLLGERYRVEVHCADHVPDLDIDRGQLEATLLNLVVNARDAMPEGGCITLTCGTAEVKGLELVELRVRDEGPGVPDELKARIFEPFFTTKAVGHGTGLGLAMAHGFLRQSGGSIRIEDAADGGAEFVVQLPPAESPLAETFAGAERTAADAVHLNVLLVEDDELVRRATGQLLRRLGHACVAVDTPGAALAKLERPGDFDLMLTDTVLAAQHSGADLARQAQRDHPDLDVVLMSGYAREIALAGERRDGLVFLRKPFDLGELADAIGRARSA